MTAKDTHEFPSTLYVTWSVVHDEDDDEDYGGYDAEETIRSAGIMSKNGAAVAIYQLVTVKTMHVTYELVDKDDPAVPALKMER